MAPLTRKIEGYGALERGIRTRGGRLRRAMLASAFLVTAPLAALAQRPPPFELPPKQDLSKLRTALISTSRGDMLAELYPDLAPWHVANFKVLADRHFFRGKKFHSVQEGYIIQAGSVGAGTRTTLRYFLPGEFTDLKHSRGMLGMARLPDDINPERLSSPTDFHIILNWWPRMRMDGRYTIFGKITRGMDVADSIRYGDTILDVTVYVRSGPGASE